MNFYDGRDLTPFLPRDKVVDALKGSNNFILPSERYFFFCCVSYNWVGLTVYELKLKKCWITADLILCPYLIPRRRKTGNICSVFSLPLVCDWKLFYSTTITYIGEKYFGWQVASSWTILVSWCTWWGYGWCPWAYGKDSIIDGVGLLTQSYVSIMVHLMWICMLYLLALFCSSC